MSEPTEDINEVLDENKHLKEENEKLSSQVDSFKKSRANWWHMRFWAGKKIGEILLGSRLSRSIKDLVREISERKISNETVGNVITHVLWRFTRIGIIAILLTIIPSAFLIVQTLLLRNQNKLVTIQNEKIENQNHLIESQRRSSYVLLLGNLMDAVNRELSEASNTERRISPQLYGQIIALSNSLSPYHFILNGKLTNKAYSPERGMLLIFLLESELNDRQLSILLSIANFKNLYTEQLTFKAITASYLDLDGSFIGELDLSVCDIFDFSCKNCSVKDLNIMSSDLEQVTIETNVHNNRFECHRSELRRFTYYSETNSMDISLEEVDFSQSTLCSKSIHRLNLNQSYITSTLIVSSEIKRLLILDDTLFNSSISDSLNLLFEDGEIVVGKALITGSILFNVKFNAVFGDLILSNSVVSHKNINEKVGFINISDGTEISNSSLNILYMDKKPILTNKIELSDGSKLAVYGKSMNDTLVNYLNFLGSDTAYYWYHPGIPRINNK